MKDLIQENATAIGWMATVSFVMFVASALVVPLIVVRIPSDFFESERRPTSHFAFEHPALRLALLVVRNFLGSILFLAGLAMLVLPGQGLLTLLAGLLLMNFPRKYRLERWLVMRPGVLRALNWLRDRQGHAPFDHPQS